MDVAASKVHITASIVTYMHNHKGSKHNNEN